MPFTKFIQAITPSLSDSNSRKGDSGRIAVVGGSKEYTGAPYFAAKAALLTGADLVHVFCSPEAGQVIKTYSPDLIVHPILPTLKFTESEKRESVESIISWLKRIDVVLIGPGLDAVALVVTAARAMQIPMVFDADGLYLIQTDPSLIKDYPYCILTPNANEYTRLQETLDLPTYGGSAEENCRAMSRAFGGLSIIQKGSQDIIASGLEYFDDYRRKNDSLFTCGITKKATLLAWAFKYDQIESRKPMPYSYTHICSWGAARLTRGAAASAFNQKMRVSFIVESIQMTILILAVLIKTCVLRLLGWKLLKTWTFKTELFVRIFKITTTQSLQIARPFGTFVLENIGRGFNGVVTDTDRGAWIGKPVDWTKKDTLLVLYCHGGGYCLGNSKMYLLQYQKLLDELSKKGITARVYSADYPLAPENIYPSQINYVVETYKQLIKDTPPSKICIMGESAGGNVALALLQLIEKMKLPLPKSCVVVSPWVDLTGRSAADYPSDEFDMIDGSAVPVGIERYLGPSNSKSMEQRKDPLVSPAYMNTSTIKNLFSKDKVKLMVTYGQREILAEGIRLLIDRIGNVVGKDFVRVDVDEDLPHAYQLMFDLSEDSIKGFVRICDWVAVQ